jgi:anthranilate synthase/aminodeoxychorismate synthase-like glutamine amidotransferase
MRIILIDNYDSFTYNIVHYMEQLNVEVDVVFNDNAICPDWNGFDAVLISPGPGLPHESGFLMDWLSTIPESKPVLGICLGLQALVLHFGGALRNLESPLHGHSGKLLAISKGNIWSSVPVPIKIGHYHSWVANEHSVPSCMEILARDEEGRVMAVRHSKMPWYALQFHPESILSENGIIWFERWIEHCVRPNSIT